MAIPKTATALAGNDTDAANNARVQASFMALKNTARTFEDLAKWFEKHPQFAPGLPAEMYKSLSVFVEHQEQQSNKAQKTLIDHVKIYFNSDKNKKSIYKESLAQTKKVLGMDLKLDSGSNDAMAYEVQCMLSLDAREWKFIAADALCEIPDDDRQDKAFVAIMQNLMALHFPELSFEKLLGLQDAGLLPVDIDDFKEWLYNYVKTTVEVTMPHDGLTHN